MGDSSCPFTSIMVDKGVLHSCTTLSLLVDMHVLIVILIIIIVIIMLMVIVIITVSVYIPIASIFVVHLRRVSHGGVPHKDHLTIHGLVVIRLNCELLEGFDGVGHGHAVMVIGWEHQMLECGRQCQLVFEQRGSHVQRLQSVWQSTIFDDRVEMSVTTLANA